MTKTENRVLIIEDIFTVAESLNNALSRHPKLSVAGIGYDVATGLRLLHELKPRIILLDLGLPDGSGFEILKEAQEVDWQCDTVVISMLGDEDHVMRAISMGAIGYLQKSDLSDDVANHVVAALDGGAPISPKVAFYLLQNINVQNNAPSPSIENLTAREHDILDLLAKGFKRREIAEHYNIKEGTVGVHINKIYQKLGVSSNVAAINALTASQNVS